MVYFAQVHGPLDKILQPLQALSKAPHRVDIAGNGFIAASTTSSSHNSSSSSSSSPQCGLADIKQVHQQRLSAAIQHRIAVLEEALDELPQVRWADGDND